ncbi:MAG: hypothetical protein JET69_05680 [Methanomassiliicoccales archaeon]|nr:hypothetical protein [Methanomassiliicoccales archaeon]
MSVRSRAVTAIAFLIFTGVLISLSFSSALAWQPSHDAIIPQNGLDFGESEDDGGGFHVILFAIATFLGLVAAVTGIRNSTFRWLRELVPFKTRVRQLIERNFTGFRI